MSKHFFIRFLCKTGQRFEQRAWREAARVATAPTDLLSPISSTEHEHIVIPERPGEGKGGAGGKGTASTGGDNTNPFTIDTFIPTPMTPAAHGPVYRTFMFDFDGNDHTEELENENENDDESVWLSSDSDYTLPDLFGLDEADLDADLDEEFDLDEDDSDPPSDLTAASSTLNEGEDEEHAISVSSASTIIAPRHRDEYEDWFGYVYNDDDEDAQAYFAQQSAMWGETETHDPNKNFLRYWTPTDRKKINDDQRKRREKIRQRMREEGREREQKNMRYEHYIQECEARNASRVWKKEQREKGYREHGPDWHVPRKFQPSKSDEEMDSLNYLFQDEISPSGDPDTPLGASEPWPRVGTELLDEREIEGAPDADGQLEQWAGFQSAATTEGSEGDDSPNINDFTALSPNPRPRRSMYWQGEEEEEEKKHADFRISGVGPPSSFKDVLNPERALDVTVPWCQRRVLSFSKIIKKVKKCLSNQRFRIDFGVICLKFNRIGAELTTRRGSTSRPRATLGLIPLGAVRIKKMFSKKMFEKQKNVCNFIILV